VDILATLSGENECLAESKMAVDGNGIANGGDEEIKDALDGWQREEIVIDLDPSMDLEFLKAAEALSGQLPAERVSKQKLVNTHNSHVKRQGTVDPKGPRLVKKLILALAYPPSIKSIRDLETVGFLAGRASVIC
jgi:hypothetical protein